MQGLYSRPRGDPSLPLLCRPLWEHTGRGPGLVGSRAGNGLYCSVVSASTGEMLVEKLAMGFSQPQQVTWQMWEQM